MDSECQPAKNSAISIHSVNITIISVIPQPAQQKPAMDVRMGCEPASVQRKREFVTGCEEGLVRAEEEIEGGPLGGNVLGVTDGAIRGVLNGAVALDVTDGAV